MQFLSTPLIILRLSKGREELHARYWKTGIQISFILIMLLFVVVEVDY
jgi:hypothetical protein